MGRDSMCSIWIYLVSAPLPPPPRSQPLENSRLSCGRPNVLGYYYVALCHLPSRSSHVVDQGPGIIVCLPLHVATEHGVVFFSGCPCCVCSLLCREKALSFWAIEDQLVLGDIWFLLHLLVLASFETIHLLNSSCFLLW